MSLDRRHFLSAAGLAACSGLATFASGCKKPASKPAPIPPPSPPVAQHTPPVPPAAVPLIPAEFRGVWVASVANIDWPTAKGLPVEKLRTEMLDILDRCVQLKLNAVLLQVRPCCDAIYPSRFEPWSEFLTGKSGQPPVNAPADYDPLAEWISAAGARGLELHAWFNPFRARHQKAEFPDAPSHISNTRPDLVRTWGDLKWLDPSEPDARAHSMNVIMDLVSRYKIDGVHLDDYFYPYPRDAKPPTKSAPGIPAPNATTPNSSAVAKPHEEFPDDKQWNEYQHSGGPLSRSDWRRSHIDGFVRDLYAAVKSANPHCMFGISPFGIWRPGNPPGVDGFDSFEGLYADARRWLREGWVDYLAPQLYWAVDAPKQPFGPLLDWWRAENVKNKYVWAGLYTRSVAGEGKWHPAEIARQIAETRKRPTLGHAHFSMAVFAQNREGIDDVLARDTYADAALVPQWIGGDTSASPQLTISALATPSMSGEASPTIRVRWSAKMDNPYHSIALRWVVQSCYAGNWRTSVHPPAQSGADIPLRDDAGAALERVAITRLDDTRRRSNSVVLEGAALLGNVTVAPNPGS